MDDTRAELLPVEQEHVFPDNLFGACLNCGQYVEELIDQRYCRGRPVRTSAEMIALLDDPKIAAAVNEKGGGRHS